MLHHSTFDFLNNLKKNNNREWFAKNKNQFEAAKKDFLEFVKTAPRNYPKDHPEIELLKYKSYIADHDLKDEQLLSKDFLKHCAKIFKEIKPLNDFLNTAIGWLFFIVPFKANTLSWRRGRWYQMF